MSTEASGSTKQTSEQDAEVQQEESQSAAEAEGVEQAQDNAEEGTESAGSDDSSYKSVTDASTRSQQSPQVGVATGGAGIRDSPESSISGGGSGTESQLGGASGSDNGTELKQGGATGSDSGTELQQGGAAGGVPRQLSQESAASIGFSGTESQQGCGSGTESQLFGAICGASRQDSQGSGSGTESRLLGAVGGASRQDSQGSGSDPESQLLGAVGGTSRQHSQGSVTAYSSSYGDSQETAFVCDSSSRASLESGVAGGISNSPDTQESPNNGTEYFEGVGAPYAAVRQAARRSSQAEFRENSRRASLESGVAGGISNSPDTQGSPNNGAESFEVVSAPYGAVRQAARRSSQAVDERAQEADEFFNKCACVCDYLRPCSRWIRKSKIFMFLKMILLIIPISALCMGLKYLTHCPAGSELPILMMLMGIAGIILLSTGLALDSRNVLCPSVRTIYFKAILIASRVMLLAVFAAGLDATYKMSPSFDPFDRENYCDMVFYYYAYYTNFVVIGIAVLAFFIYVPTLNESIEDYEHL